MKNCEYFQMMLSDFHDEGADKILSDELKSHLGECSCCADFYQLLQGQSEQIQNLPTMNLSGDKISQPSVITKIWNLKLSIPAPVAAVAIIILAFIFFNNINLKPDVNSQKFIKPADEPIETYQMVLMESQTAIKVNAVETESEARQ